MRLYVKNKADGKKIHLKQSADNRKELARIFGSRRVKIGDHIYDVNEIFAEPSDNTAVAMALGGVIGVAGGVLGVVVGSAIGALLGKSSDDEDKVKVDAFNGSYADVL